MRRISYILILMASVHVASAQTDVDEALRYSQLTYGNSARTLGVGGAFGAVGADVSTTSINPAGIGLYRSSELTLSSSLDLSNASATYIGQSSSAQNQNFNVGNWGAVFAIPTKNKPNSKWRSVNLAVNTNRLANFTQQVSFSGYNANNSYIDAWLQQVNTANGGAGVYPSQLGDPSGPYYAAANMAYQAYLINPNAGADSAHYNSVVPHGGVQQSYLSTITGFLRETNATISGNYNDRLYLGFSLGFPHISYSSNTTYTEKSNTGQTSTGFNSFTVNDAVSTSGWGFNAKLGAIVRLNNMFRVGLSVQTPTIFNLTDNYSDYISSSVQTAQIDSNTLSYTAHNYSPQNGTYSYQLITPWHGTLSAAMMIPRYGFISVDYEYVPYNAASYNFNQGATPDDKTYQTQINNNISSSFTGASNVRAGTEWSIQDFRLRAGAAYYMSPYTSSSNQYNDSRMVYTIGAGMKFSRSHLDLAVAYEMFNTAFQPYSLSDQTVPTADIKNTLTTVMLTYGVKF